jgi:hypothetical protein
MIHQTVVLTFRQTTDRVPFNRQALADAHHLRWAMMAFTAGL